MPVVLRVPPVLLAGRNSHGAMVWRAAGWCWGHRVGHAWGHAGGTLLTSQVSSFSGVMVFPLSKWSSCTISAEDSDGIHLLHAQPHFIPKESPSYHLPSSLRDPAGG